MDKCYQWVSLGADIDARAKIYVKFDSLYFDHHSDLYEELDNHISGEYYRNYLKTFKRYISFYNLK